MMSTIAWSDRQVSSAAKGRRTQKPHGTEVLAKRQVELLGFGREEGSNREQKEIIYIYILYGGGSEGTTIFWGDQREIPFLFSFFFGGGGRGISFLGAMSNVALAKTGPRSRCQEAQEAALNERVPAETSFFSGTRGGSAKLRDRNLRQI